MIGELDEPTVEFGVELTDNDDPAIAFALEFWETVEFDDPGEPLDPAVAGLIDDEELVGLVDPIDVEPVEKDNEGVAVDVADEFEEPV